jgi:hypothetical protein
MFPFGIWSGVEGIVTLNVGSRGNPHALFRAASVLVGRRPIAPISVNHYIQLLNSAKILAGGWQQLMTRIPPNLSEGHGPVTLHRE